MGRIGGRMITTLPAPGQTAYSSYYVTDMNDPYMNSPWTTEGVSKIVIISVCGC
jgi:hypothetical protein